MNTQHDNSLIDLKVTPQILEVLQTHNMRLDEMFTLLCMSTQRVNLLLNYLRSKNDEQKVAFMQPMIRKQFLTVDKDYSALIEAFNIANYSFTDYSRSICAEIKFRMGIAENEDNLEGNLMQLQAILPVITDEPPPNSEFDKFIQVFLEKFPQGSKNNGGKVLRSNPTDTKLKMIKFMNKYKRYSSKELVIKATDMFISRYRGDFSYCPTAEYFISKNGTSALATECELILSGEGKEGISNPFEKTM